MPEDLLSRAGMAYAHELSFMVCFAALTAERLMIRPDPDQGTATKLIITDIIYGLAALTLLGSGIMILAGKVLGDRTDEGLDARTTYHLLASMLGPLIIWPLPIAIIALFAIYGPFSLSTLHTVLIVLILPVLFNFSNKIALVAWDLHVTARDARRLQRMRRKSPSIRNDIVELLAALK